MALNMIWRLSLAVTALLLVAGQSVLPKTGDECSQERSFAKPDDCTSFWQCAEKSDGLSYWIESKCIDGLAFNTENEICERPATPCPGFRDYSRPLVKIAPRTIRPGCERVFQCPTDLQFFIYPDWNNCSNYNTCVQGTISPESCLSLGYPWYNPSTFACEQQIAPNNVCFFRA